MQHQFFPMPGFKKPWKNRCCHASKVLGIDLFQQIFKATADTNDILVVPNTAKALQ
jgi:hypothetical protein